MSKDKHPYALVSRRVDTVIRVPSWAKPYVLAGETVVRYSKDTVKVVRTKLLLKLGESYTQYSHYISVEGNVDFS